MSKYYFYIGNIQEKNALSCNRILAFKLMRGINMIWCLWDSFPFPQTLVSLSFYSVLVSAAKLPYKLQLLQFAGIDCVVFNYILYKLKCKNIINKAYIASTKGGHVKYLHKLVI